MSAPLRAWAALLLAAHGDGGIARAEVHRRVSADAASGAVIDGKSWFLEDRDVTYPVVLKGTPDRPWLSDTRSFGTGGGALGFRVSAEATSLTKVTYVLVRGSEPFAPPVAGGEGELRFALSVPSAAEFEAPDGKCLLVQWWQGSPYGPPLRFAITGATPEGLVWTMQRALRGNPSAPLDALGSGVLPYGPDAWQGFVIQTRFDPAGGGRVRVWQNGEPVISWTGSLGYDPATKPYAGDTSRVRFPNPKIQIEFGLYREPQARLQTYFIDEISWGTCTMPTTRR